MAGLKAWLLAGAKQWALWRYKRQMQAASKVMTGMLLLLSESPMLRKRFRQILNETDLRIKTR